MTLSHVTMSHYHNVTMSDWPVKGSIPHDMELFATAPQPGSNCWGLSLSQVTAQQHWFHCCLFLDFLGYWYCFFCALSFHQTVWICLMISSVDHLSTSLDPKTSTVGSARTLKGSNGQRSKVKRNCVLILASIWMKAFAPCCCQHLHTLLHTFNKIQTWNRQNLPIGNWVLRSPMTGSSRTSHKSTKSCSQ